MQPGTLLLSHDPSRTMQRQITAAARQLIQSFEGLRLSSYPDPGSGAAPWTCCWGHTGPEVQPGQTYTESLCERLLDQDLAHFERGVERLIPGLNDQQFGALVSWAFNVGLGAVETSSLRRRILQGEATDRVIREELPRWVNGASGLLQGLVRRRAAEVDLAASSSTDDYPIDLQDFFAHFRSLPHQQQAIALLQQALNGHPVLRSSHPWVQAYRACADANADARAVASGDRLQLQVPYYTQHDSSTDQGARMCFASSCAMLLAALRPDALTGPGPQADDRYLQQLIALGGDTTAAADQLRTLAHYGLNATFRTTATPEQAIALLRAGIPVPIGILHHGHWQQPRGGGHWLVLIGFDLTSQHWIVHDPAGELQVRSGGYTPWTPTAGRAQRYSMEGLNARWLIEGPGSGWCIAADA